MTNSKHERLINKVRKLYAMSQQVEQSPHEAEAALRNCMKLMERHGIKATDLETSDFGAGEIVRGQMTDLIYVQLVASAAGSLHDCLPVFKAGESLEMRGYDIDVTVATLTFQYIMEAMNNAEVYAIGEGRFLAPTATNKLEWRTGFAEAIVAKASAIVARRREEQQQDAGLGKSLTVQKMDAVMMNCSDGVTFHDRGESYQPPLSDATFMGSLAGNKVSLNRQVTNS